jgi:hypothetical protein
MHSVCVDISGLINVTELGAQAIIYELASAAYMVRTMWWDLVPSEPLSLHRERERGSERETLVKNEDWRGQSLRVVWARPPPAHVTWLLP